MERIDLHVHSNASDGSLTPTEVADEAMRMGLSAIALTDHDTVDGVAEILDYTFGGSAGHRAVLLLQQP